MPHDGQVLGSVQQYLAVRHIVHQKYTLRKRPLYPQGDEHVHVSHDGHVLIQGERHALSGTAVHWTGKACGARRGMQVSGMQEHSGRFLVVWGMARCRKA